MPEMLSEVQHAVRREHMQASLLARFHETLDVQSMSTDDLFNFQEDFLFCEKTR